MKQLPDERILHLVDTHVDSGALTMALNVLRRAGKDEVADALEQSAVRGADDKAGGDDSLPYEAALSELIDLICPGIDSGNILNDARQASCILSARSLTAISTDARKAFWKLALGNNSKLANLAKAAITEAENCTCPQPQADDKAGGEVVASIYITPGGEREFDDWRHALPLGRNLLYTRPMPQAERSAEREPLTEAQKDDRVRHEAQRLIELATQAGLVVTIERRPRLPLAIGHAEYVVDTRPVRG